MKWTVVTSLLKCQGEGTRSDKIIGTGRPWGQGIEELQSLCATWTPDKNMTFLPLPHLEKRGLTCTYPEVLLRAGEATCTLKTMALLSAASGVDGELPEVKG